MASRYVPCKDREEALAMLDAGLLYLDLGGVGLVRRADPRHRRIVEKYAGGVWAAEDFVYLVEEDGDE